MVKLKTNRGISVNTVLVVESFRSEGTIWLCKGLFCSNTSVGKYLCFNIKAYQFKQSSSITEFQHSAFCLTEDCSYWALKSPFMIFLVSR